MKQQAARDMNTEKEAAARKELGGFAHPIYAVSAKRVVHERATPAPPLSRVDDQQPEVIIGIPGKVAIPCPEGVEGCEVTHLADAPAIDTAAVIEASTLLYIEAERFIDARGFACRFLGCSEVDIARLDVSDERKPYPRWQIRFTGSAGGATPLTLQARKLVHAFAFGSVDHGWKDVRTL